MRVEWLCSLAALALFLPAGEGMCARAGATTTEVAPAGSTELRVRGFGLFKNLELARTLDLLLGDGRGNRPLDAGFIEDASLVLNSELVEDGFFNAAVKASWMTETGARGEALLDAQLSKPLPRPLVVRVLRLDAVPGRRAVVVTVEIEGLREIGAAEARAFFMPDAGLYTPERARAWSVARARRAAEQLRDALRARGFEEASVRVDDASPDPETGDVRLRVRVEEGPRWRVKAWRAEVAGGGELPGGAPEGLIGEAWSRSLALDAAQAVRRRYFDLGHAEAGVSWRAEPGPAEPGAAERSVTAVARVEPGPAWTLGAVRFEGAERTRSATLAARTRELAPGRPYDPTEIDAARLRLARLGVFRHVEVGGDASPDGGGRDVVFRLGEAARWQASWLIGYGSYEQIRGAVELNRTNLWGMAHRDRIELGQSLKGSRGEYRYTVPTLFNDTVEGSTRVFGLRREEPSFVRLEYGAGLEAGRDVPWIDARGSAGLSYQVLRADRVELGFSGDDVNDSEVAAITFGLSRDVRDNPIRPRSGHRWSARSELARPELGGDTRYNRVELAWSWHRPIGGVDAERWLHVGLSHGVLAGAGDAAPVNKLFFPGGESSIRGYLEGEATQRDSTGRFVGVRSTWLVNVELEQLITGRWTAVVFSDTLGTAVDMDAWPDSEVLGSIGLGVRYQSPIGPLRLEYGRNLNPRPGDTSGTVHFSIGFPF